MSPRDAFGVVVRSLGLIVIVYSIWSAVTLLIPMGRFSSENYFVAVVAGAVIGFLLILSADRIVNAAYGSLPVSEPASEP